jgi:hypothetical protein
MKKRNKTKDKMFENIFDILATTQFSGPAAKELARFMRGKEIGWDKKSGIISIGRDFIIKLQGD